MKTSNAYINRIKEIGFDKKIEERLICKAESINTDNTRNYLNTVLELPWNKLTKEKDFDFEKVRKQLDKDHFIPKEAKENFSNGSQPVRLNLIQTNESFI